MKAIARHYLNGLRLRAFLRRQGLSKQTSIRIGMWWDRMISPLYIGSVEIKETRRV